MQVCQSSNLIRCVAEQLQHLLACHVLHRQLLQQFAPSAEKQAPATVTARHTTLRQCLCVVQIWPQAGGVGLGG